MISVTFTPPVAAAGAPCGSTAGMQSSVLKIFDNDPASPQVLTLSGTALDYCLIPPGAISATVSAGGTAEFQLDAQAQGFTGAVALACAATIPQGACSVTPASLMLTGDAPVPFQVGVTTTAGTASAAIGGQPGRPGMPGLMTSGLAALLILFTLICGSGSPRSRLRRDAFRMAQASAILVMLSLGLMACFGSQGAVRTMPGTPTGTYPLTITGTTTTGATRTIGLTLTVQ